MDRLLYKKRNEVERYFLRLKRFRKVFTRYDKLDRIYISVIMLAMIFDALFLCEHVVKKENQHRFKAETVLILLNSVKN